MTTKQKKAKKRAKPHSAMLELRRRVDILWTAHQKAELTMKLQTLAEGTPEHQAVVALLAKLD